METPGRIRGLVKPSELRELQVILYQVRGNPTSMVGLTVISIFIVVGVFAPWIAPRPGEGWGLEYHLDRRFQPPSLEFPLGTDDMGRDVLSRVILGARTSLLIAVAVVGLALLIGIPIGIIGGYYGGVIGNLVMRVVDMFLAFPPLLLALAIAATLGRGLENAVIALAISWWPWYSRLAYIQTNSVKTLPYIDAARVIGVGRVKIMLRHILPNTLPPILVQASMDLGSAILEAAGLSFLGLGVQHPTPDWGVMVSIGRMYVMRAWWIPLFPGLAIFIVVLAFNLLGDALRESIDPRLRRVRRV